MKKTGQVFLHSFYIKFECQNNFKSRLYQLSLCQNPQKNLALCFFRSLANFASSKT